MSEIEDKILGKNKAKKMFLPDKECFTAAAVWKVSKDGCGSSCFNGKMVYEMLSDEGKQKASRGRQKFFDNGFVFQRQK